MKILLILASLAPLAIGSAQAEIPFHAAADRVLGQPNFTTSTAVSPGTPVKFNSPTGIAIDPLTGKFFISDGGNNRILRYRSADAAQSGELPEAVLGQLNFSGQQPNQDPNPLANPTAATLDGCAGIFVDTKGRLWVADYGNSRVLMFENASHVGNGSPADRVFGQPGFTTKDFLTSDKGFTDPTSVWVDSGDRLWVADSFNNRILRFDAVSSKASGAAANGVLGQNGFNSKLGLLGPSFLDGPIGICVDADGTLWVADSGNGRVVGFEQAAILPNTLPPAKRVFGAPDFNTMPSTASASRFLRPSDVRTDGAGNLWIIDQTANRAVSVAIAQANGSAATGLLGEPDFLTISGGTTPQLFKNPFGGLAFDSVGHLWLGDSGNNRVLRFSPATVPAEVAIAPTVRVNGKKKITTGKAKFTIKGVAGGSVASVIVKVGKAKAKRAAGTTNWKFKAALKPGKNKITVSAIGSNGLASAPVRVTVIRE